ncbi:unnamed protein product [Rhizoctonia solani]|uniref:Uncharacterized protein n=1 Tax=Rhizoctonia solani TaxID=456999 RepID=A0A8H3BVG7_9AGAM|nr:unnamed protein product [Rhizoctonia solani]
MGIISLTMIQDSPAKKQAIRGFNLPPDVILCLADNLLDMGRTHDLATLSLLRPDLSPTIQGILFSHIILSDFSRYDRLARTLRSERSTLPTLVRRITAVLDTEPRNGGQHFSAKHLTDLYTLCPRLSYITVSGGKDGGPGERLFPDVLDAPRLGALVAIESLTLTGAHSNFGLWLLSLLPKLRALRLFGIIPLSQFNGPSPSSGENLRHVTWGLASPPTLEQVKWLFASSSKVIGGSFTLITIPSSSLDLERIHEYCRSCGMLLRFTGQALAATNSVNTP